MAVRKILRAGDETLRKKSREVISFDRRLILLLDDMTETLHLAEGLGLAAPQVGVLKRVVVINNGGEVIELVNPEIIEREGEQREVEGCLSIPEVYGITRRPMSVKVKAFNRLGKLNTYTGTGLIARAFCHEIDHLNGVLFTDNVIRLLSPDELK
jgi:peptide deformylase